VLHVHTSTNKPWAGDTEISAFTRTARVVIDSIKETLNITAGVVATTDEPCQWEKANFDPHRSDIY